MAMHEILLDEISRAAGIVETFTKKKWIAPLQDVYCVSDGNPFGAYLYAGLKASRAIEGGCYCVADAGAEWPFGAPEEDALAEMPSALKNAAVFLSVDCRDQKYADGTVRAKFAEMLERWLALAAKEPTATLYFLPLIQAPAELPEGVTSFAEREYDYYLAHREPTCAEGFYLELEGLCRRYVRDEGAKVNLLRYVNVYGPAVDLIGGFSFEELIKESSAGGSITVTEEDAEAYFSCTYIVDAFKAIFIAMRSGKMGNVFNVAASTVTAKDLKVAFQKNFKALYGLKMELAAGERERYHCLNSLKLARYGWKNHTKMGENVYRMGAFYTDQLYDMLRCLPIYSGKLEKIKKLELDVLKFVDQVCRENDIQYFLAGGSLLGAVRHNNIIPWDDDLDIAMLREDFEKFRRICPRYMPENMTYESPQNDSGSHYHFDKIRLKDTYFSTNYSSTFRIRDGIFFDVIVYDQTSNIEWLSRLQIRLVAMWTRVINVRWYNKPRKKVHYRLTKLVLPVMRLIPFRFYHWVFERLVRAYSKKKNAKYVIDGLGQNIRKGRFPKEILTEVEYVDFGDMKAPIPKGYDAYLRHFYGDHYMELLPVSKRASGHHLARIDLGGYLFSDQPDASFREVMIDGELYEHEESNKNTSEV